MSSTPRKNPHNPWKMMVGKLLSFWEVDFSGAMLNFRWVHLIPYLHKKLNMVVVTAVTARLFNILPDITSPQRSHFVPLIRPLNVVSGDCFEDAFITCQKVRCRLHFSHEPQTNKQKHDMNHKMLVGLLQKFRDSHERFHDIDQKQ